MQDRNDAPPAKTHPPGKLALSVFLITRNEEARLARTLRAVAFADDIVVVDSESTDATVAIAKAHGARVIARAFEGYGPQKAFAEGACRHPWRLNIDADEEVTPALAQEITTVVDAGAAPAAYALPIHNVYPGDVAPRPFANDYRVVRLYHKEAGRYRDHALFDRVDVTPGAPVRRLRAPIHHHAFTSWSQLIEKLNNYTSFAADAGRPRARARLLARLPFEFPLVFLKSYFLRRHVFGGWKGLAFALVQAFFRTVRLIKMLERVEGAPGAAPVARAHAEGPRESSAPRPAKSALTEGGGRP